jgi:hypothetical protein
VQEKTKSGTREINVGSREYIVGFRLKNAKMAVFNETHRGLKPLKFQYFVAILRLPRGKTL